MGMLTVIVELLVILQKEKKKTNIIKFNFGLKNVTPVHSRYMIKRHVEMRKLC